MEPGVTIIILLMLFIVIVLTIIAIISTRDQTRSIQQLNQNLSHLIKLESVFSRTIRDLALLTQEVPINEKDN